MTDPTIRLTPAGTFLVAHGDQRPEFTPEQAEDLARALRAAVFAAAPELVRVTGYDAGDSEPRALPTGEVATYAADGYELLYGLRCPYLPCQHTAWGDYDDAVLIVDEDERWSHAGYLREEAETGAVHETVRTGGADTDYSGLGYRCPACYKPVTLPDGIEEVWN